MNVFISTVQNECDMIFIIYVRSTVPTNLIIYLTAFILQYRLPCWEKEDRTIWKA